MKSRFLLPFIFCLPCLALGADGDKKISFTAPPAPVADYSHAMALEDMSKLPASEAFARLHPWLLSHCFGGVDPKLPAFQQPRVAQALWLAVVTDAIGRKSPGSESAAALLDHLVSQKALDAATGTFFQSLWKNADLSAESRDQRAADFLRIWLAPWKTPALKAAESNAVSRSVQAGVRSLDFLPQTAPPVSRGKN